jgi:regulator of sigma E protease
MGTLIMAGQLILALAILVSLHEWGHYIAARSFGIRVEKFFIFFDAWGVKLFSKKIGGTEWGIGWLPLGGYVKISGMIDESLDTDQMSTEPENHEFRSKPAWQRLIVMIGGVTVNFILGILIFALALWHYGQKSLPNAKVLEKGGIEAYEIGRSVGLKNGDAIVSVKGEKAENFLDLFNPIHYIKEGLEYGVIRDGKEFTVVVPDSTRKAILESRGSQKLFTYRQTALLAEWPEDESFTSGAKTAGIQGNDLILMIDSMPINFFDEIKGSIASKKGETVEVLVQRGSEIVAINVLVDTTGKLGVGPANLGQYKDDIVTEEFGFIQSFPAGYEKGMGQLKVNIIAFGEMFKGKLDPVKSVSGPVGIAKIFGATWNWQRFWEITGMLSFILAFMNLLPIPALDGGHVIFLLIEMVRRKPLPEKVMYYFQIVGMIILFALMGFIIFIDTFNAIFN